MSAVPVSSLFPASQSTSLSSWVCALKRSVDAKGIDAAALMTRAGLDADLLSDPLARYPSRQVMDFWKLAIEATGDRLLGVCVARHIAVSTFHALGFALLASSDLASMFDRMTRYFRIVTDAGEIQFTREAGAGMLTLTGDAGLLTPADEEVKWCALDALLVAIVGGCRMLYGAEFKPLELRLQRPRPERHEVLERAFGHVPVYGCADNTLVVDEDTLSRRLLHANPELARVNDEATGRYLSALGEAAEPAQFLLQLRQLLRERLPAGDPPQIEVAAALGMTSRTLQRKLAETRTTYRDLLNDTRHALALEYLGLKTYSVSEIAYLLGFAEVSAFTRAFRRWTGTSPSGWRDGQGAAPPSA